MNGSELARQTPTVNSMPDPKLKSHTEAGNAAPPIIAIMLGAKNEPARTAAPI